MSTGTVGDRNTTGKTIIVAVVFAAILAGRAGAQVLHYELDETSGTTAADSSGNGYDGTLVNFPADPWTRGVIDGGLEFGGNDLIETNQTAGTLGFTGNFTAAAWVNLDNLSGDNTVFGTDETGGNNGLHLVVRNNHAHMGFYGNDTGGVRDLETDHWYNVAWRYDGGTGEQAIFVNGVLDRATTGHAAFAGGGNDINIGRWHGNRYFDGTMDEVRIYDTNLTAAQIQDLAAVPIAAGERFVVDAANLIGSQAAGVRVRTVNGSAGTIDAAQGVLAGGSLGGDGSALAPFLDYGGGGDYFGNNAAFPGGNRDNFSTEATGLLVVPSAGIYTMGINTDDGGRVEIGSSLITVDQYRGDTGNSRVHFTVDFEAAGLYPYRVTHNEIGGGQKLEFYSGTDANGAINPGGATLLVGGGGLQTVATGEFFVRDVQHNTDDIDSIADAEAMLNASNPPDSETDGFYSIIDFYDSGGAGNFGVDNPYPNGGGDDFATEATAMIYVSEAGTYTFGVNNDDGARLQINGTRLINDDVLAAPHDAFGQITFDAPGLYDLRHVYFERGSGAECELFVAKGAKGSFDGDFRLVGDVAGGSPAVFSPMGWKADVDGNWSDATKWRNGAIPDGTDDFVSFSLLDLADNRTVTLDGPRTVGAMRFGDIDDTGGAQDWTIAGANTLTLDVAAGAPTITVLNDTATIAPVLAGSDGLTKEGAGTLRLDGNNTYTGATTINEGTLVLNNPSGGAYTYTGGDILINNGSTLQVTATAGSDQYWFNGKNFIFGDSGGGTIDTTSNLNFVVYGGSTVATTGGAQNVMTGTAGVNLHSADTLGFAVAPGTDPVDLLVATPLGNAGGITKTGAGTMRMTGAGGNNSYTGLTTVDEGTLEVGGGFGGDGGIRGDITVNDTGTFQLLQDNIIVNSSLVTVNAGGTFDLSGQSDVVGALAGGGDVIGGGTLTFDYDPGTAAVFSGTITGGDLIVRGYNQDGTGARQTLTGTAAGLGTVAIERGNSANDDTVLELAGAGSTTAGSVAVGRPGSGTATLEVTDTHTLNTGNVSVGDANGHAGHVVQDGGTVNAAGHVRVGHWPNNTSTYTLSGGLLDLTGTPAGSVNPGGAGEQDGVLYLGVDGTGEFTMTGGTVAADAIVLDARGETAGTDRFTLDGGVFTVGANGIRSGNFDANTTYRIDLGGGTLRAGASWDSPLDMTLTNAVGDAIFDTNGNAITLSGDLDGPGGIDKIGTGILVLSGTNTYTGTTDILGGTLRVAGGAALPDTSPTTVGPGGILDLDGSSETVGSLAGTGGVTLGGGTLTTGGDGTSTTFGGVISETGGVVKIGAGTQTLSGANTYTGTTDVRGGTLRVAGGAALSDTSLTTVGPGGILDLDGGSETVGSLAGDGGVTLGGGTLTTGGDGTSTTFGGVISEAGDVIKTGGGTFTLTGANTYAGTTTVSDGTLALDGGIAGDGVVDPGGTLSGGGTVGGNLDNGGTLAPAGDAIGTLTVNGDLAHGAGAVTGLEVDGDGNTDRVAVGGAATLAGGTVEVSQDPAGSATYGFSTDYTFLNAAGGVTGQYDNLLCNIPFLDPYLLYTGNDVTLRLLLNNINFGMGATSEAGGAAGGALNRVSQRDPQAMLPVKNALQGLPAGRASVALDQMSGAGYTGLTVAALKIDDQYLAGVRRRILGRRGGGGPAASGLAAFPAARGLLAAADEDAAARTDGDTLLPEAWEEQSTPLGGGGPELWFDTYGVVGNRSGDTVGSHFDYHITGVIIGVDHRLSEHLLVGMSGGWSDADVDFDNRLPGGGEIDSYHGSLYGSYTAGPWFVDGIASYGYNRYNTYRHVTVGPLRNRLKGDYHGNRFSFNVEGGYRFDHAWFRFEPLVGLQFTRLWEDGFAEHGGAGLNLVVDSAATTSCRSTLGFRLSRDFRTGCGVLLTPELTARWAHEYSEDHPVLDARFAGSRFGSFRVNGDRLDKDSALVELGLTARITEQLSVYVSCNGEFSESLTVYAGTGGVRWAW